MKILGAILFCSWLFFSLPITSVTAGDVQQTLDIEMRVENGEWLPTIDSFGPATIEARFTIPDGIEVQEFRWLGTDGIEIVFPFMYRVCLHCKLTLEWMDGSGEWHTQQSGELNIDPGIRLNELMPNPEGDDAGNEWIELLVLSEKPDLSWAQFRVQAKQVTMEWPSPDKGIVLVPLAKASLPNCSSQPCTVTIELVYDSIVVDTFVYTETKSAQSWSREMGTDAWTLLLPASPGEENLPPPAVPTTLIISEILPNPNANEAEWLEIYNWGTESVNLEGWAVWDNTGKSYLPSTTLPPGGYIQIAGLKISLNNSGDMLTLVTPNGEELQSVSYEEAEKGWALIVDIQTDTSMWTTTATPGAANIFTPAIELAEPIQEKPPKEIRDNLSPDLINTERSPIVNLHLYPALTAELSLEVEQMEYTTFSLRPLWLGAVGYTLSRPEMHSLILKALKLLG